MLFSITPRILKWKMKQAIWKHLLSTKTKSAALPFVYMKVIFTYTYMYPELQQTHLPKLNLLLIM